MKAIINGKLMIDDKLIEDKVLVFDKRILDICEEVPNGAEVIDAKGLLVGPGLIDVHIHGCGGYDVMDASAKALETISETVARFGVTSYLATTMTMSQQDIKNALDTIETMMKQPSKGAKILGCHLEGPYISETFKGAQNAEYIVKPTFEQIQPYSDTIKLITIAPEEDENHEFIKTVRANTNIKLSIGHTSATYEEAKSAIEDGITHATHTFNGMTGLHHRDPGVVGAILTSDIFAEIIADTIHVHKGLFKWFSDNVGLNRVVLVTDSMRAGGMDDGVYDLGGQEVVVCNKCARLRSGSLAGSVLTLNQAIKNYVEHSHLSLNEVYRFASLNPATSIGVEATKGSIAIGKDADLVVWDENLEAISTFVEGTLVYSK
ncbi:MAG TPA: N-acetylglucosamine-6-phosphate deacetylase [Firmicutes bacterium]|nr:N-acetylglucosamine-6-phosphate deacetylase [Bacillota bacterium]